MKVRTREGVSCMYVPPLPLDHRSFVPDQRGYASMMPCFRSPSWREREAVNRVRIIDAFTTSHPITMVGGS